MTKRLSKKAARNYRDIATLLHEMTCTDAGCNYPDEPDMGYLPEHVRVCMGEGKMDQCRCSEKIQTIHCGRAVMAENLAAAILRTVREGGGN
jgi:hypothetical protein